MKTPPRGRGRGGRGGHEPRLRIQEREIRAYELSIAGKSQTEIAAILGISQPAVSKLLRRVEDRRVAEMAKDQTRLRIRSIAQFNHIYSEAMQGYERSKGPTHQRRQRKVMGTGQGESTVAELVTEEGAGDPRFLEIARRAVVDSCKLAGLDTVPMTELTKPHDLSQLSDEEVKFRLERAMAALTPVPPASSTAPEVPSVEADQPPPLTPDEHRYADELARRERVKRAGAGG